MMWTPDLEKQLEVLWNDGTLSAAKIAVEMGHGLSRNSIIGKACRMCLAPRRTIVTGPDGKKLTVSRVPSTRRFSAPKQYAPIVVAPVVPDPLHIPLMDLKLDRCRYPTNEDGAPGTYCGHPISARSYCAAHFHLCYRPLLAPRKLTQAEYRKKLVAA